MPAVNTINDVVNQLNVIIARSREEQSAMGYFAMLYRRMTLAVAEGIKNGVFEDGKRMEQLDTVFAGRYLDAWEAYTRQQKCSNAWYTTFEACNSPKLIVLQHLLAGVNAHINLDLGIAAAIIAPGDKIFLLQHDFDRINDVIASLMQAVQDALAEIWFPLRTLERVTNNRGDAVLNFSIATARKTAWANAVALAFIDGSLRNTHINTMDTAVVTVANRIIHPGMLTALMLSAVRSMENQDVRKNIDLLMG